jgi:UDP-N-acetylmuramate--alanine ligase
MHKVHFIGIGGTGISAIALLLLERGWQVSGTDKSGSRYFDAVTAKGAYTLLGHSPELALAADVIVRSSAVHDDDPEVIAAHENGIPVLKRNEFLPELTAGYQTLAVAGSHGKTTCTAMLVTMLRGLGVDPTFILGAQIRPLATNAHAGSSDLFVIEADEYDNMFLGLSPKISLLTNVEYDHPDFFPNPADYYQAYAAFIRRTQPDGAVITCAEDEGVRNLLASNDFDGISILSYGYSEECDYRIQNVRWNGDGYDFNLTYTPSQEVLGEFVLSVPGRHNLLNAAGALAVLHQSGMNPSAASESLSEFVGTERRFEQVCHRGDTVVINDYGHHPTQLDLTLEAAHELYPDHRLWAVWEPHTFSRTDRMQTAFTVALQRADRVVILPTYAARETVETDTPQQIAQNIPGSKAAYFQGFPEAADFVAEHATGLNVVIVFSAGKGPEFANMLCQRLDARRQND